MKTKPKTPYQRLLEEIRRYVHNVKYRHTVDMFHYPKAKLGEGWSLIDLNERVKAADQLGYDVILSAQDVGLVVRYKKREPKPSWGWE